MQNKIITNKELEKFGEINNLSNKARALLLHQMKNWDLVKNNFQKLSEVKIKEIDFDDFKFKIQFNPSRITSTSAKVDKISIENRACFLCEENLPEAQKGIKYNGDYLILINPYPVFKQHLTIPHIEHIPQKIDNVFNDLLKISYDLRDDFFVFYNGPKCGASAPDHLHFQAGLKNSTPIENYYNDLISLSGTEIYNNDIMRINYVNNKITKFILFESSNKVELLRLFNAALAEIKKVFDINEEPMINIFSIYKDNEWKVFLYLREKHRPIQYFNSGDSQLLISPAAVDLAGLCITPREVDFNRVSKIDLIDICGQVLVKADKLEYTAKHILEYLAETT